jgi:hypothetical protein
LISLSEIWFEWVFAKILLLHVSMATFGFLLPVWDFAIRLGFCRPVWVFVAHFLSAIRFSFFSFSSISTVDWVDWVFLVV